MKIIGVFIEIIDDIVEGVRDLDVLYIDVWVLMGELDEVWKERIVFLEFYCII